MNVARIGGATRVLNAPAGWDKNSDRPCLGLPIRDQPIVSGVNVMVSAWQPSENEVEALRQGASIQLHVVGTAHPPVMLAVGEPPVITDLEVDAEIARILAMSEDEVLAMSTPLDLGMGRLMNAHIGMLQKVADARREAADARAVLAEQRVRAEAADARVGVLEAALAPFAEIASTWTVRTADMRGDMLTLSNGERMCALDPADLRRAAHAADGGRT